MSDVHSLGREIGEHQEISRSGGINNSNNYDFVNRPSSSSSSSEIRHLNELSDDFAALLTENFQSDVVFLLDDGEKIEAHRLILAARSEYFKALMFNGMRESEESEIRLVDTNTVAFKQILKYVYTSKISLTGIELDVLLDFLSLANRYSLLKLVKSIGDHFKDVINIQNLCVIFNAAQLFSLTDLIDFCLSYSDRHAIHVLSAQNFINLSSDSLDQLLRRDSFYAPELEIFFAVQKWSENNPEEKNALKKLLELVRLPLIAQFDLLEFVRPSKLVKPDDLLDAITIQTQKKDNVNYRGVKVPNTNVATIFNGATVICCENENGKKLLCEEIPEEQRAAIHYNPRQCNHYGSKNGIIIDLGRPHIINLIMIDLCSKSELQLYSYIVDVSMSNNDGNQEEQHWKCVADYSNYACRRRQRIYFEDSVIRYVRIRCAEKTFPKVIVKRFEALYTDDKMPVDSSTGLVVPTRNIATIESNALVVEGVSRCRNALINGETMNYDWDSGYTCHQIGSGTIIVELPQPYILSSMRILLWDCDDRYYSYYVAVSIDQSTWITVVDKTDEECRAWQDLVFNPIPVVFIKLVGTRNSSNEVFHVVHLEAPANRKS